MSAATLPGRRRTSVTPSKARFTIGRTRVEDDRPHGGNQQSDDGDGRTIAIPITKYRGSGSSNEPNASRPAHTMKVADQR